MSVFSSAEDQEAIRVATTNTFARICDGRQLLVYSLRLDSPREVAMILPVPMAVGAGAVGFTVAIEQVSHFETTIAENEPGCMTLTFTLADGESLQFRLRDRPVTSLRRWCARVGLPCSV